MGDRGPETKPEEQYPLLKVDGGGDVVPPQMAALPPGWGVACSRNQSWCSRWPEFVSACWMTLVLFGLSFLVFYALGMGAYRRQQFIIMKCNSSRPGSNVFYHQIVPRGASVPFLRHAEWLATLASQYPRLHFNVYYLQDDTNAPRPRNRFIHKLIPYYPYGNYKSDDSYQQALIDFQRRYHNVNVTVMPLSKYMASTPLRFKWRTIPTSNLPFYARVHSVWEHGGVGVDLAASLEASDERRGTDRRLSTILQQHNDGTNKDDYANALNKIDKEDDTAIFSMCIGFVNRVLNDIFNRTLTFETETQRPDLLIRTHRAKREANNSVMETKPEISNSSNPQNVSHAMQVDLHFPSLGPIRSSDPNDTAANITDSSQFVVFYDFQFVSDVLGPSYLMSEPLVPNTAAGPVVREVKDHKSSSAHLLSIDAEGTFVAATSRLHPFLGHLISAGCRTSPKLAIQDALLTQCSGLRRDDLYCNNIYVL